MEGKTINLNVPYVGLNSQPVLNPDQTGQTLGTYFGMVLGNNIQGDPFLFDRWARAFFNGEDLTVSEVELSVLIKAATECQLPATLRVQILNVLNK